MRLRFFLLAGLALLNMSIPAMAKDGEITTTPICFELRNTAPYKVYGSIATDYYTMPDGQRAKHHSNFNLESGKFAKICSTGPFFDGRKLDIQIKTLVPVFDCRTALTGPLVIHGERSPGKPTKTWIDCIK